MNFTRRLFRFLMLPIVVVALFFALLADRPSEAAPGARVNVRISGDMQDEGGTFAMVMSPDGRLVAYEADAETDEAYDLYVAPATGQKPPLRLAEWPVAGPYTFTADSTSILYLAYDLYRLPVTGGTPLRMNAPLVTGGSVMEYEISPVGDRVVYLADQDTLFTYELYSVPIAGGATTKLNGSLVAGGQVIDSRFVISPLGNRVVYLADQDTYDVWEVYSVPIAGGAATKLNGALVAGGAVLDAMISPLGDRVIYWADQDTDNALELYSVPITGGAVTKLNGALVAGGKVGQRRISPLGDRVVYTADQDTDGVFELYSVPITGGAATKLNEALVAGGSVLNFDISPDGARVVYLADQDTDQIFELYSVPIAGGAVTKLNGSLAAGGGIINGVTDFYKINAAGSRVVYLADQDTDEVLELYSVPIAGGATTKLNGPLAPGGDVALDFMLSADGSRVLYLADQDADEVHELYSVPVSGGPAIKVNNPLVAGGDVYHAAISPNNQVIVYGADQLLDNRLELFATFDDVILTPPPAQNQVYIPAILRPS